MNTVRTPIPTRKDGRDPQKIARYQKAWIEKHRAQWNAWHSAYQRERRRKKRREERAA